MKHKVKENQVVYSNAKPQNSIKAQIKDTALIIGYLRDKMYSDKIQTPVQEYISNGKDAMKEVGSNKKMKIVLPTGIKKELRIRDYGSGLSHERMSEVFTQYAASDKTDSNDSIGGYGLGSKSGWAYSPVFMVNSFYNGIKRGYIAQVADNQEGSFDLVQEEETNEENGIEIIIPVKNYDENKFVRSVYRSTMFWENKPIVLEDSFGFDEVFNEMEDNLLKGDNFRVVRLSDKMRNCLNTGLDTKLFLNCDGIPYQVPHFNSEKYPYILKLKEIFKREKLTVLDFKTGEIDIQPDRERIASSSDNLSVINERAKEVLFSILNKRFKKINKSNSLAEYVKNVREDSELFKLKMNIPSYKDSGIKYSNCNYHYDGIFSLLNLKLFKNSSKILDIKTKERFSRYNFKQYFMKKKTLSVNDFSEFDSLDISEKQIILLIDEDLSEYKQKRKIRNAFLSNNFSGLILSIPLSFKKYIKWDANFVRLSSLELPQRKKRKTVVEEGVLNIKGFRYNGFAGKITEPNTKIRLDNDFSHKYVYFVYKSQEHIDFLENHNNREIIDLKNYLVDNGHRLCSISKKYIKDIKDNKNFISYQEYLEELTPKIKNNLKAIGVSKEIRSPLDTLNKIPISLIEKDLDCNMLKDHMVLKSRVFDIKKIPDVLLKKFSDKEDSEFIERVKDYQSKFRLIIKEKLSLLNKFSSVHDFDEKECEQIIVLINQILKDVKFDDSLKKLHEEVVKSVDEDSLLESGY